jgi:hypothetical protein
LRFPIENFANATIFLIFNGRGNFSSIFLFDFKR